MTLLNSNVKPVPDLGEDTWELFEAIEDSFGFDLGDYQDLCGVTTRELAEMISKKAKHSTRDACLSVVAFYKLRRSFESLFGVPRSSIRPTEAVDRLLPSRDRNSKWQALQEHVGLTLPRLHFPIWIPLLALGTPPTLLVLLRALWRVPVSAIWIFDISCALYLITFVTLIPAVDERFHLPRVLPNTCKTFGGLVAVVTTHNYASLGGSNDENDVVKALRRLISMQLGISFEEVSPDTHIPNDLNIY